MAQVPGFPLYNCDTTVPTVDYIDLWNDTILYFSKMIFLLIRFYLILRSYVIFVMHQPTYYKDKGGGEMVAYFVFWLQKCTQDKISV